MKLGRVEAIARAVLYEGYNLYPYRPSSLKNRQRWTFGGVFPRDWARHDGSDRSAMQTQCLVRGGADARLAVQVRFLHIVAREIGTLAAPAATLPTDPDAVFHRVPCLEIDGVQHLEWEEARERDIIAPPLPLAELAETGMTLPFAFADEREIEPIRGADGRIAGAIIRQAAAINGAIEIAAEQLGETLYRVTVRIENQTPIGDAATMPRAEAQRLAMASTHTLLGIEDGVFVSLLDPPPELEEAAAACRNEGTWPVLVGDDGEADTMLSSPIILYDYPKIAPESPGDLFDGCEIDEILTLRILTLTEAEKREMAAADPRTRALLERTEALTAEELARLHGTFRDPVKPRSGLKIGDRVRLKPRAGGDVMDIVLAGQIGIVEGIECDFEDRLHVAVTILGDPGRDLGMARMPGHRFFFSQDEVEPLGAETAP